jgi:hypothetical protein
MPPERYEVAARLAVAAPKPMPVLREGPKASNPWDAAVDVHDFVNAVDPESDWLVPRLIARGAVTAWFSPRGIGKTLVAHHVAVDLARQGMRVLLIDRDNPRREVKRRLRAWGLSQVERERLSIIARDQAPPLTDTAKWAQFPVGAYDLVILDSFDSATEGVGEGDSSKPSLAVAALLDIVRSTLGPGALVLGNTIKSGTHGRGCGIVEDRLDIVFEVRDATGFKPSGTKDWWLELPPSGRDAWAERAARRKKRGSYRLAFVPSKFRIGEEPDPFAFEISCEQEPWTCTDVTNGLAHEGEQARAEAETAKAAKSDQAVAALKEEVATRHAADSPMEKRDEAESFLVERGLTRKVARALISERNGHDWLIRGRGSKSEPQVLVPVGVGSEKDMARMMHQKNPPQTRLEWDTILAAQEPRGRPESTPMEGAPTAARSDAGIWPSAPSIKHLLAVHDWEPAERVAFPDDEAPPPLGQRNLFQGNGA